MKQLVLLLLVVGLNFNVLSADDQNWFCAQRLVKNLSIGAVWSYGHNEVFSDFKQGKIKPSTLIENTAVALLKIQDKSNIASIIQEFSDEVSADETQLTLLFAYVLDGLNNQRQDKIRYILNYGSGHSRRVEVLQVTRAQIRQAIKDNNSTKLKNLEEQYQWQVAVLDARKKHNPYLCEQVVDVDAYAFSLASEIGKYIK